MKAEVSWFYIILSIVFVAISALGKNKKKADVTTQRPDAKPGTPAPRIPKTLEDILTEVLDLPKQPEVVVEQPTAKRPVFEEKYGKPLQEEAQSLETIEVENQSLEEPEVVKPQRVYTPVKPLEESAAMKIAKKEHEPVIQEWDVRQGIIYAEILNRKYF